MLHDVAEQDLDVDLAVGRVDAARIVDEIGIDATAEAIANTLQGLDLSIETIKQPLRGNHLVVRSSAQTSTHKQVLLVGHMDTVFPEDTDFNWYKVDNDKSYGPGVVDMKGGLVVGIYALKALDKLGLLKHIPITFVFNSDEEKRKPMAVAM